MILSRFFHTRKYAFGIPLSSRHGIIFFYREKERMAHFIHGESRNKVQILLLLKELDIGMMREQIYRFVFDRDLMSYFDFQNAMFEMEEDGLIAAIPRAYGQAYRITPQGEEMLKTFRDQLPNSAAEATRVYARENREILEKETVGRTAMRQQTDGSYMVRLCAAEEKENAMAIEILAPTREMAVRIRENWEKSPDRIYNEMLSILIRTEEKKEG